MPSLLRRRARDAIADHGGDLVRGVADLTQDLRAVLVEPRRQPHRLGLGLRPGRRHLHAADRAFGRMVHDREEAGRLQMLVVQDRREVVHRHHGHVGLGQQVDPLGRGARLEDARELGIDDVDIGGAAGEGREFGIGAQIVAARRLEEVLPLLVVVDDDAEIAVRGLVRPAVAREVAGIAALVERRLVGEPAHVVAHDEAGHGLEHRDVDALAAAGAIAMHEAGADRADRSEADDAVDQRVRHIARHAVTGLRHQAGSAVAPWIRSS